MGVCFVPMQNRNAARLVVSCEVIKEENQKLEKHQHTKLSFYLNLRSKINFSETMIRYLMIMASLCFLSIAKAADSTFYFTTSDSVKLYVHTAGKGEPCLFVHGGPGSTSYYFEGITVGRLLEKNLFMVYYDQRGAGRSGSPSNKNYSLQRMSQDMEEIKNVLRIKKWNVMGHSFAGLLITDYATRYQGSLLSLISVNTTIDLKSSMQSHLDFGMSQLGLTDSVYTDKNISLEQRVWKVHEKLTEKNIWYKLMFRNAYEKLYSDSITLSIPNFNHDFANQVWNLPEYTVDRSEQTKQIAVPVLIFTGDADYAIGPDHYKRFLFPNKTILHYIGGHAPFQEEPQWFSEKVVSFIQHKGAGER